MCVCVSFRRCRARPFLIKCRATRNLSAVIGLDADYFGFHQFFVGLNWINRINTVRNKRICWASATRGKDLLWLLSCDTKWIRTKKDKLQLAYSHKIAWDSKSPSVVFMKSDKIGCHLRRTHREVRPGEIEISKHSQMRKRIEKRWWRATGS